MSQLYALSSDAVPDDAFVAGFTATEALSELYRVSVGIITTGEVDVLEARGQAATLTIRGGEDDVPFVFQGRIAEATLHHAWTDGRALYELVLRPRVWGLSLSHHSRVFVDMSVPDIIAEVFEDDGVPGDAWEQKLSEDHPAHFHTGQYKESRWAFLSRLMEREGLYYFFAHGDRDEKLIITDHLSCHEPLRANPARYVPLSQGQDAMAGEAIFMLTRQGRSLPKRLRLRDFDHLRPALDVASEQRVGDPTAAQVVLHGDHDFRTEATGAPKAKVRAEALQARELTFRLRGRLFGLRSGYRFTVEEHPHDRMNTEYLAVRVHHSGIQDGADTLVRELLNITHSDDYRVEAEAIVATTQWRAEEQTPIPRISGVERGFIDGPADSAYAQIDEHGRYKVKLHFDIDHDDNWDGTASTWLRMLQPHGGTTEGFHFPLRKNTEVMIIFLGGHPDRPVIAGAVPNATHPSPVVDQNHTHNVIQTGGANRIDLEDQEGKQYIDLFSPPANTFIHLGDPPENRGGFIHFHTGGNQLINIGGNRDATIEGSKTLEVTGTFDTEVGGTVTLEGGGEYHVEVSSNITFENGAEYHVESSGKQAFETGASFDVEATGPITFESGGKIESECKGDFTVESGGSIHGEASGDITSECAGDFAVESGTMSVETGMWTGDIGAISWEVAGGVNINAPGGWTVNAPKDLFQFGTFEAMGSKATELTGLSTGATGVKLESTGMSLSLNGMSGSVTGANWSRTGIDDSTSAVDLQSSGPDIMLVAILVVI
ncbi:MAG: type VI secretion system tip protein TssI/VgrG [Myxococcota bacterium]